MSTVVATIVLWFGETGFSDGIFSCWGFLTALLVHLKISLFVLRDFMSKGEKSNSKSWE